MSSFGVSDQRSVGSSPSRDTCVLKQDTWPLLLCPSNETYSTCARARHLTMVLFGKAPSIHSEKHIGGKGNNQIIFFYPRCKKLTKPIKSIINCHWLFWTVPQQQIVSLAFWATNHSAAYHKDSAFTADRIRIRFHGSNNSELCAYQANFPVSRAIWMAHKL